MAQRSGVWGKLAQSRAVARWAEIARDTERLDIDQLRREREQATRLRTHLDLLIHRAGERLRKPVGGARNFPCPAGSDWAWRPELWRAPWPGAAQAPLETGTKIGTETTFFHDANLSEIALRQRPNLQETDLAPYRLEFDVLGFDGGFLSVVFDLPQDAVEGLRKDHILQVDLVVEVEDPLEVFLRLNVQHGPNTEQMTLEAPCGQRSTTLEFDLAYSALNEKRVEKVWFDLIFENPAMNRIALRDITLSRRLRAAL